MCEYVHNIVTKQPPCPSPVCGATAAASHLAWRFLSRVVGEVGEELVFPIVRPPSTRRPLVAVAIRHPVVHLRLCRRHRRRRLVDVSTLVTIVINGGSRGGGGVSVVIVAISANVRATITTFTRSVARFFQTIHTGQIHAAHDDSDQLERDTNVMIHH